MAVVSGVHIIFSLVQQALRLIQLQNRRLTASGAINDEITQCYSSLVRTVQGAKSLAWADGQSTATTPRHCLNQSFVEVRSLLFECLPFVS